ncbi:hypothetical protein B7767_05330 [Streptomyces sp. 13-12-16]|nr:hypothetical protein B7767_05330 [Streptomyces sp. 13-12-16]
MSAVLLAAALLVIVDAANAVGSVPDGWWRDRRGAADRPVLVVTADRELRRRVTAVGAEVAGPRSVPR